MISTNVIKIQQFEDHSTYLGKIKFGNLMKIVRFSNRIIDENDGIYQKYESEEFQKENYFQRNWSLNRIKEISKFIERGKEKENLDRIPIFPTPIILSLSEIPEKDMEELKSKNILKIQKDESALVVDGQHRLKGMENYYEKTGDKDILEIDMPIVFIVGLDNYRLGEVFANINFEQKKVNKSLYYDIFGVIPSNNNEIRFSHALLKHLNNSEESVLMGMVDMIGDNSGFFSQAQFVDVITPYFTTSGIWRDYYYDYIEGGKKDIEIAKFMRLYFKVIKENWNSSWPKEEEKKTSYNYILCKSTGIGAITKLIYYIFNEIKSHKIENWEKEISKLISRIPEKEADKIFIKNGEFSTGSSYGLQSKLAKRLRKLIFGIDEKVMWKKYK